MGFQSEEGECLSASYGTSIGLFTFVQHDSFKQVFDEIADLADVLVENIIVSHNKKRVFPSASPHGIGVWTEAELGSIIFLYVQIGNLLNANM